MYYFFQENKTRISHLVFVIKVILNLSFDSCIYKLIAHVLLTRFFLFRKSRVPDMNQPHELFCYGQVNQPLRYTYKETCGKLGHYFTVPNLSARISNIKSFLSDD